MKQSKKNLNFYPVPSSRNFTPLSNHGVYYNDFNRRYEKPPQCQRPVPNKRPDSFAGFDSYLNMNVINHALVDFSDYLKELSCPKLNPIQKSNSIINMPLLIELNNRVKYQKTYQNKLLNEERIRQASKSSQKLNDLNKIREKCSKIL